MTTIHEKYALDGNNLEVNPVPALATKIRALKTSIDPKLTNITIPPVMDLLQNVLQFSDHLADAANQVLDGEDPSESMAKYTAMLHIQGLSDEVHRQHRLRQVDAINAAADTIILTIREEVFEPAVERIKELSEEPGEGWDLDTAISAKDFTRAAVIDEANRLISRLNAADESRRLLHPGAFEGPAAYGLDPDASLTDQGSLTWWMRLVEDDVELRFPSLDEWHQLHNSTSHREHRAALEATAASDLREPINLSYENK